MMRSRLPVLALGLALLAATAQAQLKPPAAGAAAAASAAVPDPGLIADTDMQKAGEMAAHAWLLLLDRQDWGTAWDASSAMFRQSVPLAAWMDGIPNVRKPFGAFVERQPIGAGYKKSLPGHPPGDYVTSVFQSKFANKGDVQETVTTMREPDGRWRVTGYTAR
jgi:hypothetical protein